MDMKTLELIEAAIVAVKAVRNHYGGLQVKHTPGPWHIKQYDDGQWGIRNPLFAICNLVEQPGPGEEGATARLIASAPELLRACQKALEHSAIRGVIRDQLDAVVAKAEGEKRDE